MGRQDVLYGIIGSISRIKFGLKFLKSNFDLLLSFPNILTFSHLKLSFYFDFTLHFGEENRHIISILCLLPDQTSSHQLELLCFFLYVIYVISE
jgi:hypothetical protein